MVNIKILKTVAIYLSFQTFIPVIMFIDNLIKHDDCI